jgi:hypothetical protein
MPPQGSPPDLHQTVHQAAERMGLDPQAAPLAVNQALAVEPLRALSQEINAMHAAGRPEVIDRAIDAFRAVDLAYNSSVALLRDAYQMIGWGLPDWLRTRHDFVTNQAPQIWAAQAGAPAPQPPTAQPGTAQAPAQGTAPQPGTAQPGTAQPQGAVAPAPQPAAQPGPANQPQGAAAPAPPTQPGR